MKATWLDKKTVRTTNNINPYFFGESKIKDFTTSLRKAALVLWQVAVFVTGIGVLAIWLAAWRLERAIGQALPRFVAALPEKYHPVLLKLAAFTVKPGSKDWQ